MITFKVSFAASVVLFTEFLLCCSSRVHCVYFVSTVTALNGIPLYLSIYQGSQEYVKLTRVLETLLHETTLPMGRRQKIIFYTKNENPHIVETEQQKPNTSGQIFILLNNDHGFPLSLTRVRARAVSFICLILLS